MSTLEAVVTCENGSVCVPIDNFRGITAYLEDGLSLGTIHTIKSVKQWNSDNVEPPELPVSVVASVESANPLPNDRISQLLPLLNVNFGKLSEVEAQKLKDLVIEYHDVFALEILNWNVPISSHTLSTLEIVIRFDSSHIEHQLFGRRRWQK